MRRRALGSSVQLVLMRKSDAKESKDIRGYRAAALPSMMAKWYCVSIGVGAVEGTGTAGMEESSCGMRNGVGCCAEPSTNTLGKGSSDAHAIFCSQ